MQPRTERDDTDESLRLEREKADETLAIQLAAIEETADEVLSLARARADELLIAARAKTDHSAAVEGTTVPKALKRERVLEDQAVDEERETADDVLREERAERSDLLFKERDETDRDLLSERAHSDGALAARDEFLGIVSHDLRNMLAGTIGFATLIAKEVTGSKDLEQILGHATRIQRSSGRMNRLIGDLVDVASIEGGNLAVTQEMGHPTAVVCEAIETFQPQAAAKNLSLTMEVAEALVPLPFDAARILQVLANLLSNAIKFTPAGGAIVVGVGHSGDEMVFSVRDTGIGIAPRHLAMVFERFLQLGKDDRRGVGLGLYISKSIVQGHGGRIWVASTEGVGSTFFFALPIAPRLSESKASVA